MNRRRMVIIKERDMKWTRMEGGGNEKYSANFNGNLHIVFINSRYWDESSLGNDL
ncbi:hypothetical protein SANA_04910 [Gottschalkiaceae bacterium SANA]|nr:hypothetical protein SANA_04910 [Gottschalkiaceae bacterium SANA]